MCDKELLVSYLYDEIGPAERRAFDGHLRTCRDCRAELQELRGARSQIRDWAPPEPDLAFHIVRNGPPPVPRSWRSALSPAWALAAAAVLVLSVASAIANVEIKYGPEGLMVRTGWSGSPTPPVAAVTASPSAVVPVDFVERADRLREDVEVMSRRIQELEAAAAQPAPEQPTRVAAAPAPSAALLRQVRQIVSESEGRQQQELALRIMQVLRDVDGRQRQDAEVMQRSLARVQGQTDTALIRQREMEKHVFRVGLQQQK